MENPIYLDYNATTPLAPEVTEAMRPYLETYFGNPSSSHSYGTQTKQAIEKARTQLGKLLNCFPDEIVFTSGGSEANNYAIKGIAYSLKSKGKHIITSSIEHPAVTEVCLFLKNEGFDISFLPVNEHGLVEPSELKEVIRPDTVLISIMHANNETGTIQPIKELAAIAKENAITFHTDASQSVGKISTDTKSLGIDLLTIAGHKLYAPKGIGALYVKRGTKLQKLIHGADHERNLRAGTENVLEIVGLGTAAEIAQRELENSAQHTKEMRDLLYEGLKHLDTRLNGHPKLRLPNTLSISFKNIEANTLLSELTGIAASAGAACHSDNIDISHVLKAMQVPIEYAMGTIRFSTGKFTTKREIKEAIKQVTEAINRLKPKNSFTQNEEKNKIKLTQYTHGLGCACKIRPQYLERILKDIPIMQLNNNILVGLNNNDDAAVYKINKDTALVQTLDFFTPVVDDPYMFGAIAAANALSDIYAMGAKPIFALNIVGFPDNRLPEEVLKQILKGATDKASEAGIPILGGHTVEDTEPKFGMVVSGLIHPEKTLSNDKAQERDAIILTKPLGTGIIATAAKKGIAKQSTVETATKVMSTLNKKAAETLSHHPINTCTDVTGFGLLGHLKEILDASSLSAEIDSSAIPFIEGVEELAIMGEIPGGTKNNIEHIKNSIQWRKDIPEHKKYMICDAQTSGGLLVFVPEEEYAATIEALNKNTEFKSHLIGKTLQREKTTIKIN